MRISILSPNPLVGAVWEKKPLEEGQGTGKDQGRRTHSVEKLRMQGEFLGHKIGAPEA